jgi:uncharacterized UBP type Zn finger protein
MGVSDGLPSQIFPEGVSLPSTAWTADMAAIFTPIRFVKTEVIDVDKSGMILSDAQKEETKFFQDENLPVLAGYDRSILSLPVRPITQGLKNFGTTCFVNSVLQLFANLTSFRDLIGDKIGYIGIQGFSLVNFLKQIFVLMFEPPSGSLLAPSSLVKNISYIHNSFVPYKQQDAMTFFRNSLKVAATEEKTQFGTRWIAELFAGEDKRRLTCPKCSHVQVIYTPFMDVGVVGLSSNVSPKVPRKIYSKLSFSSMMT